MGKDSHYVNDVTSEAGWQDGQKVRTLVSQLSWLGSNPDAAINRHAGAIHQCMCRPSLGSDGREAGRPAYRHWVVDVKDPHDRCPSRREGDQ